ncbi:hypothetical protein D3C80_1165280 [compost metagenome]
MFRSKVFVSQERRPVLIERLFFAVDEHQFGLARGLERVTAPQNHARDLAGGDGSDAILQTEDAGGIDRNRVERGLIGKPMGDGDAGVVAKLPDSEGLVITREGDPNPSIVQKGGVLQGRVQGLKPCRKIRGRIEDHRNARGGDFLRHHAAFFGARENDLELAFLRQGQDQSNIRRPRDADQERLFTGQDRRQGLHVHVREREISRFSAFKRRSIAPERQDIIKIAVHQGQLRTTSTARTRRAVFPEIQNHGDATRHRGRSAVQRDHGRLTGERLFTAGIA